MLPLKTRAEAGRAELVCCF